MNDKVKEDLELLHVKGEQMKHLDVHPCTVCGGSGEMKENCNNCKEFDYCTKEAAVICNLKCSHCKCTKLEPFRVKIEVPEGYEFNYKDSVLDGIWFRSIDRRSNGYYNWKSRNFPYKVGQTIELVCDVCGGIGYLYGACYEPTKQCECITEPAKTIKFIEVEVQDNEFVYYLEEV